MIARLLGLPKHIEVLLLIISGIALLSLDSSLFQLKSSLEQVWSFNFDPKIEERKLATHLKYILSGVIFVRTFTVHLFLATYIVMLWPALFENHPNLIIPWLVVGSIRCLLANAVTLSTGSFVCAIQKGYHPTCIDFIVSQCIEHGPSVYAWLNVFGFYKELQYKAVHAHTSKLKAKEELALRRKRTRCLSLSSFEFNEITDDGRNLSVSALADLLHYVPRNSSLMGSRSLDTLLKIKCEEYVKEEMLSLSGDLSGEYPTDSICEKTMRILNMADRDVKEIRLGKGNRALRTLSEFNKFPIFTVGYCCNRNGNKLSSSTPDSSCSPDLLKKNFKGFLMPKSPSQYSTNESRTRDASRKPSTVTNAEVELTSISMDAPVKRNKNGKKSKNEDISCTKHLGIQPNGKFLIISETTKLEKGLNELLITKTPSKVCRKISQNANCSRKRVIRKPATINDADFDLSKISLDETKKKITDLNKLKKKEVSNEKGTRESRKEPHPYAGNIMLTLKSFAMGGRNRNPHCRCTHPTDSSRTPEINTEAEVELENICLDSQRTQKKSVNISRRIYGTQSRAINTSSHLLGNLEKRHIHKKVSQIPMRTQKKHFGCQVNTITIFA